MESFTDHGIVLSARAHGEGGAIVALLTQENGRHAGYVHGAHSSRKRGMLEPGSAVKVEWRARVSDSLGTYTMEADRGLPPGVLEDPLKLSALMSACALCDSALPEREGHAGLYYGLQALMTALGEEHWEPVYVMWEIALLKELGFGLDLTRCAGGGDPRDLTHVSPKSGRAISAGMAEPYLARLLPLPQFLRPEGGGGDRADMVTGLRLTAHFLEHWVFAHHTKGVPEARIRFQERAEKSLISNKSLGVETL